MIEWKLMVWLIVICGSFVAGWLLRSIVADKQIRELDAIIDGLRLVLARRDRDD